MASLGAAIAGGLPQLWVMGVALRGCCWPRLAKQGSASLRVLEGPNVSLAGGSAASVTGGLHTPAWGAKGSNES